MTKMKQARRDFAATLLKQPIVCLAEVHKKRADVEYVVGAYPKANEDYARAKTLFSHAGYASKCGEVDLSIGNVFLNMGVFDKAEQWYSKALEVFSECRDENNIAKCYRELGKVHQFRENLDAAVSYYQESQKLYDKMDNIEGQNVIMQYLADVYRTKGEYDKALVITEDLQKYYCESAEYGSLCRINKLIGNVYMRKGDNEKTKKYLDAAYQYTIKSGESSMAMYILCDLGLACYNQEEYETACGHFEQCLNLAEKLDSSYMKAINLVNLADAYLQMGNMERSKEYINKATTINHNIGGLNSEIQRIQKGIAQKEGGQEKSDQA